MEQALRESYIVYLVLAIIGMIFSLIDGFIYIFYVGVCARFICKHLIITPGKKDNIRKLMMEKEEKTMRDKESRVGVLLNCQKSG